MICRDDLCKLHIIIHRFTWKYYLGLGGYITLIITHYYADYLTLYTHDLLCEDGRTEH